MRFSVSFRNAREQAIRLPRQRNRFGSDMTGKLGGQPDAIGFHPSDGGRPFPGDEKD
jgi:hypothetical protein